MEKFSGPLSRRYGTALFESLKELFQDKQDFIQANDFIQKFSSVFTKKVLKSFQTHTLSIEQKQELLATLFGAIKSETDYSSEKLEKHLFNFFLTILKNKRTAYIPYIFNYYFNQSDAYLNIVRAQIVSATPMTAESLTQFEQNIANNVQKKIVFSNDIDESLKCGFVVKIGSTHIDASLKSFLTKLTEAVR